MFRDVVLATGVPPRLAGVNRKRCWARRHAVESSAPLPLELDTEQLDTRPLAPIWSEITVVPDASARIAAAG